jgi:hypothetical protein
VLVKTNVCAADTAPCAVSGNVSEPGARLAAAGAAPEPVSCTGTVLKFPPRLSAPEAAPSDMGLKTTCTVQPAPAVSA